MMKASPRGLPSARKPMRVLRASETTNTPPTPSPENRARRELATEIAAKITELGRTVLNREEAQRKIGELVFGQISRREDSEFA